MTLSNIERSRGARKSKLAGSYFASARNDDDDCDFTHLCAGIGGKRLPQEQQKGLFRDLKIAAKTKWKHHLAESLNSKQRLAESTSSGLDVCSAGNGTNLDFGPHARRAVLQRVSCDDGHR